jgi:hypothetical protein
MEIMGILQQLRLSLPQEGYSIPKTASYAGRTTLESRTDKPWEKFGRRCESSEFDSPDLQTLRVLVAAFEGA